MSGHHVLVWVSIVVQVVNNETFLLSVLISSDFSEQFWRFSWKHGAINEANVSFVVHLSLEQKFEFFGGIINLNYIATFL